MSRNSPIPRLSIVVPIGRDLAAFERTLISVLENQPTGCEVLVPHDGSYDDPFDLCGEVRFVVADSDQLDDLVSAAAKVARGRFVHVLADGLCATAGWVDEAMEKFEHFDAAAVAPVIRYTATGKIIAAGWCEGSDRLCKQARHGDENAEAKSPRVVGAYLQASFWRTDILRSLGDSFTSCHSTDVAYVYEHLIRGAGWRCVLATECELQSGEPELPWESTSPGRGLRLRAIRNHFTQDGWSRSVAAAMRAALANLLHPKYIAEALGQAVAPLARGAMERRIQPVDLPHCEDQQAILTVPDRSTAKLRRAA